MTWELREQILINSTHLTLPNPFLTLLINSTPKKLSFWTLILEGHLAFVIGEVSNVDDLQEQASINVNSSNLFLTLSINSIPSLQRPWDLHLPCCKNKGLSFTSTPSPTPLSLPIALPKTTEFPWRLSHPGLMGAPLLVLRTWVWNRQSDSGRVLDPLRGRITWRKSSPSPSLVTSSITLFFRIFPLYHWVLVFSCASPDTNRFSIIFSLIFMFMCCWGPEVLQWWII